MTLITIIVIICIIILHIAKSFYISPRSISAGVKSVDYQRNREYNSNSIIKRNVLYVAQEKAFHSKIQLNLSSVFLLTKFLNEFATENIQGVYTVINNKDEMQFVGNSFDVVKSIKKHYEIHGADIVHTIRVQTFAQPTLDALIAYKNELVRQTNPWGNAIGATGWDENKSEISNTNTNIINISDDDEVLSSLKQSIADANEENKASNAISSPFDEEKSRNNVGMKITASDSVLEFTKENVDIVLNEIRPYLIADGGNVAVVEVNVEKCSVSLELQGACGSCPSSTTTMKMGIERVLKENFPNLKDVINLSQAVEEVTKPTTLTIESVNDALAQISSAVKGMGGIIAVESVDPDSGIVTLKYKGPTKLRQGVELVVKDVKYVQSVVIKSFDDE